MQILYHHPMSAGSRYIRILLSEYAQEVSFEEERPWERRKEFLAMNPAATLPVLYEPDLGAICGHGPCGEFLDETLGAMMREKRLMPENPENRAEVRRLVEWFMVKMEQEVNRYLVGERVFKLLMKNDQGGGAPDSSMIRAGRSNLKQHLKYVNWLASTRDWLGGTKMTQADVAAAAGLSVLDYLGEVKWEEEPAAKDWYQRMKSRPSFRPILAEKLSRLPPASHYADLDF